mmetsp:Transcript_20286/g.29117  ORF Transcript_20286/g.29117 Transcript_20286/m.29117 type:complete len:852 (-) Transcript_20286:95-2650(-)|eukprot:CAMPEP_0185029430 /NCGR_PEP_ID=MMETSP1103-20130426/15723_1 /TAXON_ID=36769 /ORGANISM="Paraphysomonas bandaiensis, Strain Caron Lab Isolate" /LENGTH=851 /DNA_ID=CAMNT_0027564169 /DNA_START=129 /DNA_END=2684 /DNA_ORIENTATION=+
MKKLRAVVRSISPFSRKRNTDVNDPGPSVPLHTDEDDDSRDSRMWSLEGIDFLKFLRTFYTMFNPDKVSSVEYIYDQYQGDELVLICQLSEKYDLSRDDMQAIIDTCRDCRSEASSVASESIGLGTFSSGKRSIDSRGQGVVRTPSWQQRSQERRARDMLRQERNERMDTFAMEGGSHERSRGDSTTNDDKGSKSVVTPMSLQDIINTSRRSDSLSKKSVRFSNNMASEDPSLDSYTDSPSLSRQKSDVNNDLSSTRARRPSPPPWQPQRTASPMSAEGYHANLHSHSTNMHSRSETPVGVGSPETDIPSVPVQRMKRPVVSVRSTSESFQRQPSSGLNSVSSEPRLWGTPTISSGSSNQMQDSPASHKLERGARQHSSSPILSRESSSSLLQPGISSLDVSPDNRSSVHIDKEGENTQSIHLEEMRKELERTRQALNEADKERDAVLQLLQEMATSPGEMQDVVEAYLDKYGKRDQSNLKARTLEHQPSGVSKFSLRLQDLGDRRDSDDMKNQPPSQRDRSPGTLLRSLSSRTQQEKPYMAGTASSSKRSMELALAGKSSGNYPAHGGFSTTGSRDPSPNGSVSSARERNMARGESTRSRGGRWIRPSSADRTRGRSPSPAGSDSKQRSSQSPSPSNSFEELDSQYRKVKKVLERSTSNARSSYDNTRNQLNDRVQEFEQEKIKAVKRTVTGSPQREALHGEDDWIACVDPKTKKTYYYSKSRRKSTWTPPVASSTGEIFSWSPPTSTVLTWSPVPTGSRASTPTGSRSSTPTGGSRPSSRNGRVKFAPNSATRQYQRSQSPAESTSSQKTTGSLTSQWQEAVDPKSGRTYWFNRSTRKSTWKRPAEATA